VGHADAAADNNSSISRSASTAVDAIAAAAAAAGAASKTTGVADEGELTAPHSSYLPRWARQQQQQTGTASLGGSSASSHRCRHASSSCRQS
jgi:hypothetical protein